MYLAHAAHHCFALPTFWLSARRESQKEKPKTRRPRVFGLCAFGFRFWLSAPRHRVTAQSAMGKKRAYSVLEAEQAREHGQLASWLLMYLLGARPPPSPRRRRRCPSTRPATRKNRRVTVRRPTNASTSATPPHPPFAWERDRQPRFAGRNGRDRARRAWGPDLRNRLAHRRAEGPTRASPLTPHPPPRPPRSPALTTPRRPRATSRPSRCRRCGAQ